MFWGKYQNISIGCLGAPTFPGGATWAMLGAGTGSARAGTVTSMGIAACDKGFIAKCASSFFCTAAPRITVAAIIIPPLTILILLIEWLAELAGLGRGGTARVVIAICTLLTTKAYTFGDFCKKLLFTVFAISCLGTCAAIVAPIVPPLTGFIFSIFAHSGWIIA